MKRIRKLLTVLTLCLALSFVVVPSVAPMQVYAAENKPSGGEGGGGGGTGGGGELTTTGISDTGNAIQDIMNNPRFEGAISSISKITGFVDIWFARIISLVSFFIISAALLKNACAGAYVANSKFWDKVADAHQKTEALSLQNLRNIGQSVQSANVGSIKDLLLGFIPNIKAFTDFDDADIEPKAYFMKAIPQMIACVVIGIFIYNGYYRDTAATVGEMGSVMIERTLGSVNPDSFINKIFNTTGWPKSPWDQDKSREGKWKQAIYSELKSIAASNYTDITSSQQKAAAVSGMAQMVQDACATIDTASKATPDSEGYVFEMSGIKSYASVRTDGRDTYMVDETDPNNIRVNLMFDMTAVGSSTTMTEANRYAYVTFTLKKAASDGNVTGASGVRVDDWGVKGGSAIELTVDTVPVQAGSQNGMVTIPQGTQISISGWTSAKVNGLQGNPASFHYRYNSETNSFELTGDYSIEASKLQQAGGKICIGQLTAGVGRASVDVYIQPVF